MKNIADLKRRCKYSAESVYVFSELKNRGKAREAMLFHEMKIVMQAGVIIVVCQLVLYIILNLLK